MPNLRILAAFVLLSSAWGSSYLMTNIAVRDLPPFNLVAWRLGLGVAFLLVVAALTRPALPRRPGVWAGLAVYGLVGVAAPLSLVAWGQQYVDSSLAAVLVSMAPIFTMVLANAALQDDRMTPGRVTGVLLGFAGVVVLMSRDLDAPDLGFTLLANGSLLLVAACYASGSVIARRFTAGYSPILQAVTAQLVAGAAVLAVIPATEGALQLPTRPVTWLAVVWVGLFSTGIAFTLFYFLLHRIGPTRTQSVNYLILLIGGSLGVLVNNEPLSWHLVVGGALIAGGLATIHRKPAEPAAVADADPAPAKAGD